jgi:iron complex outermembrane receptor protein
MEPQGNATGAVTTITPEGEGRHGTLAEEILQGRVPGLDIVNSGGVRTVRVRNAGRGDSQDISIEPLLIIDGVPRPVGSGQVLDALTGINFEDVAKIQVLRDASSTAIYGTQGANGVIKITLKHD